jgi:hypothetical protein
MAKLTTEKKNAEPKKEFGLPSERKYPMPDANHFRPTLAPEDVKRERINRSR